MENITKLLVKKIWKRCVTLPLNSLQRGMTLPFWCSLSLMTLPSETPASPPRKKRTFPKSLELNFQETRARLEIIKTEF